MIWLCKWLLGQEMNIVAPSLCETNQLFDSKSVPLNLLDPRRRNNLPWLGLTDMSGLGSPFLLEGPCLGCLSALQFLGLVASGQVQQVSPEKDLVTKAWDSWGVRVYVIPPGSLPRPVKLGLRVCGGRKRLRALFMNVRPTSAWGIARAASAQVYRKQN